MLGIDPAIMEHKLNVDPTHKIVIQKKRHMGPERAATATVEVQKPLEAFFVWECQYPEWISNIVLVKKPNGTWRMCVDLTYLNKACPKHSYPPKNRQANGYHNCACPPELYGGLSRVPSNTPMSQGSRKDCIRNWPRLVLLQGNALRVEEHGGHIPTVGKQIIRASHRSDHGGIYGWHDNEEHARHQAWW